MSLIAAHTTLERTTVKTQELQKSDRLTGGLAGVTYHDYLLVLRQIVQIVSDLAPRDVYRSVYMILGVILGLSDVQDIERRFLLDLLLKLIATDGHL